MQIVSRILQVAGCDGVWCGELGKQAAPPEFAAGARVTLRFDLRSTAKDPLGVLLPLPPSYVGSDAYCFTLDGDYDQGTAPKVLASEEVTLEATADHTWIDVRIPDTSVPALLAALELKKRIVMTGELAGYSGGDPGAVPADFVIQCEIHIRNRVYIPGYGPVPEEVLRNREYLTAVEIRALIAEALRPPKGDPGEPGQSAYAIAVALGYAGTEAEWLASLRGADGGDAYEIAAEAGYAGTRAEWLEALRGDPGLTAYEVACAQGFTGTVDAWLASLKGAAGDDLSFDATGELSELDAFSGEKRGFVFAAASTDAKTKITKLYLFAKRSDDFGDWCNPAVITWYERVTEINALPPVEFKAPTGSAEYFSFDLSKYPYSTVCATVIDTAEGEQTLPYGSVLGVRKITKKSGKMCVYFGSQCPEYSTGRIYLSQFLGPVASGTSDPSDPSDPSDFEGTMYYGYIPASLLGGTAKVTEVTAAMAACATVTRADVAKLDKVGIGVVPAGALVVVLLPLSASLTAAKFDGISAQVPFAEDNGQPGTGANGTEIVLNSQVYRVYGEFKLIDAELFIYIN